MSENAILLLWFISALISGSIGGDVGRAKMAYWPGFCLGFLLGPLGWLLALVQDQRPQCPWCRGRIPDYEASVCMHCRRVLVAEPESPRVVAPSVSAVAGERLSPGVAVYHGDRKGVVQKAPQGATPTIATPPPVRRQPLR